MSTGTNAAPTPRPTANLQIMSAVVLSARALAYPPTATSADAMIEHGFLPNESASAPMTKHPNICPAKMDIATLSVSQFVRLNSFLTWGRMRDSSATSAASLAMVMQVTSRRNCW